MFFPISWPAPPKHDRQHFFKKWEIFLIVPRGIEFFDQSESCILPLFSNFGTGMRVAKTWQARCVCCVYFFCCDVLLAQAVLAPVELQNIVIVTNLCYIFPVLFSLILQVWLHCHICFPPFSALQVFAVFLRFASAGFVLYHFFRPDRPIAQVVHNYFLLFLFCVVFFSCSFVFL